MIFKPKGFSFWLLWIHTFADFSDFCVILHPLLQVLNCKCQQLSTLDFYSLQNVDLQWATVNRQLFPIKNCGDITIIINYATDPNSKSGPQPIETD